MKRLDFIKNIFGATAIALLPNQLKATEKGKEYSFDELFHRPYNGNNALIFPKPNTLIYNGIKESIGINRVLDKSNFHYYLGINDVIIPLKDKYTFSDFLPFVLCLKSYYRKNDSFSEAEYGTFFKIIDNGDGTMHFDVFVGGIKSQYGS